MCQKSSAPTARTTNGQSRESRVFTGFSRDTNPALRPPADAPFFASRAQVRWERKRHVCRLQDCPSRARRNGRPMDSAACWPHPLDADARQMQQALQPAKLISVQPVSLMISRPTNASGIGPPIETMGGLQSMTPLTCATNAQTHAATASTAVDHKALLQLPNTPNQHAEVPNAWKGTACAASCSKPWRNAWPG